MVLEPLGGEGQQGEEEHVGGRVGDELHKRVSHEPGFEINPKIVLGTFLPLNGVP